MRLKIPHQTQLSSSAPARRHVSWLARCRWRLDSFLSLSLFFFFWGGIRWTSLALSLYLCLQFGLSGTWGEWSISALMSYKRHMLSLPLCSTRYVKGLVELWFTKHKNSVFRISLANSTKKFWWNISTDTNATAFRIHMCENPKKMC